MAKEKKREEENRDTEKKLGKGAAEEKKRSEEIRD